MKNHRLFREFGSIDDRFISEADPTSYSSKSKKRYLYLAASVVLILGLSLWLFIPYGTFSNRIEQYSDSEYYALIQKLEANQRARMLNGKKNPTNNFENYVLGFFSSLSPFFSDKYASVDENSFLEGDKAESEGSNLYVEVTDNQVNGVIEGDLIKRSEKHIFYFSPDSDHTLRAYSIEKENSRCVGAFVIAPPDSPNSYAFTEKTELFLSQDAKRAVVILSYTEKIRGKDGAPDTTKSNTDIILLDVFNPSQITEIKRVTITGNYHSSRTTNGKLLIMSEFLVPLSPDYSDEASYLPQITENGIQKSVPMDSIISPESLSSRRYTVVSQLDFQSLSTEGFYAFLSYSDIIYVSETSVFATRACSQSEKRGSQNYQYDATEISRLDYGSDGLQYHGSTVIQGHLNDRYSIDEYNGILRVVTTVRENVIYRNTSSDEAEVFIGGTGFSTASNASLFCIDIETWKIIASVERFAPDGESVRSARFQKDEAYVCTSVMLSDPVFFFDLSDLAQIQYKETGTIEGYSTSLTPFGEGFLLGIGISDWNTVKIEIYEETETEVRSVDAYTIPSASYAQDYKAYFIDRENKLIGLGYNNNRYLLLSFDGYKLVKIDDFTINGNDAEKRAVYIDHCLYLFSASEFRAVLY